MKARTLFDVDAEINLLEEERKRLLDTQSVALCEFLVALRHLILDCENKLGPSAFAETLRHVYKLFNREAVGERSIER